ncbi:hypothetical protein [Yersinia pekkanenii]|uniref:Uncharacterized protein n=1 Tax=Yersinia pekkanenii TaxID=1288385 RepID=A0A0T9NYQ8_9GAMM|nr:hypothetical protein [Yersinia pekkanenii]CNH36666.1 Uncharacterised protein [Yersinia pekkanenii]CRY65253.1 Uncharacterised protein [Yersinia pekkanenii]
MKKQSVSMLCGLLFCGAVALSISQAVRAVEVYNQVEHPVYFCITCYYPLVWF